MRALFIGGTGFISSAVSRMAVVAGLELWILNRGLRGPVPAGARWISADIHQPDEVEKALQDMHFEVVVDWIAYNVDDIERDLRLLRGRTSQFIFISSASAYQKPPAHYLVTEETPLVNPFWDYSQKKIACEQRLMRAFEDWGFPVTIVRPSLTYDPNLPIAIGGWGCYTLIDRLKKGLPIIVHGDGTSLWVVTHAEDLGRGLLGLFGNPDAIGQAFHITSDEVLTWDQIYRTIAEAVGVEANIVHIPTDFITRVAPRLTGTLLGDKAWSVVFDNSKIKRFVPEFEAVIPFREGVRRTLAWFDAEDKRRRMDHAVSQEMDLILSAYGEKVNQRKNADPS